MRPAMSPDSGHCDSLWPMPPRESTDSGRLFQRYLVDLEGDHHEEEILAMKTAGLEGMTTHLYSHSRKGGDVPAGISEVMGAGGN